jgi:hypothetical protein
VLEGIKSLLTLLSPLKRDSLLYQIMEGPCDRREAMNKLSPKIACAQERLYLFQRLRDWPFHDSGCLFWVNGSLTMSYDRSEILDCLLLELAFDGFTQQTSGSHYFQDFTCPVV